MGNAGFALLAFMAGVVLVVIGARGTYTDVANVIIHPAPGDATIGGNRGSAAGPSDASSTGGRTPAKGPGESIFGIRL